MLHFLYGLLGSRPLKIKDDGDSLGEGRSMVTYRMEISGPAADTVGPELGPRISEDFPETLAALTERAEAMDQDARGEP